MNDVGTHTFTTAHEDTLPTIEKKLHDLLLKVESTEFYRGLMSPEANPALLASTMKWVYKSIHSYQPHVTEATFTAVGRMPKHDEQLIKDMILQQVEEVEHADMALRDFLRLGGTEAEASTPPSPPCMAVAAMCRMLGEHQHPACYLGFMYIFEALTPIMSSRVQMLMDRSRYNAAAREFIDLHATEDIRHTDIISNVIRRLVAIEPGAANAVLHGFDCFAQVYPIPVWQSAFDIAKLEASLA